MAKDVIRIDFSKEEDSGAGRVRWPEDDYHVKIVKAKAVRSSQKDTPGIAITFKVLDGKKKGKTIVESLWLTPKSLSRIRLLLEAVGVKVPKSAVNLPLKKLVGKKLWIEIIDQEQDGYDTKSVVAFQGFVSEDDYEASPEDPEDDDDLDDDDEDDEDDDEDEDDDDEDDEDEDDDDDDDDEEEEVKPKKKRKKKAPAKKSKKGKGKKKKAKDDDDDDDEDELDLDDL